MATLPSKYVHVCIHVEASALLCASAESVAGSQIGADTTWKRRSALGASSLMCHRSRLSMTGLVFLHLISNRSSLSQCRMLGTAGQNKKKQNTKLCKQRGDERSGLFVMSFLSGCRCSAVIREITDCSAGLLDRGSAFWECDAVVLAAKM